MKGKRRIERNLHWRYGRTQLTLYGMVIIDFSEWRRRIGSRRTRECWRRLRDYDWLLLAHNLGVKIASRLKAVDTKEAEDKKSGVRIARLDCSATFDFLQVYCKPISKIFNSLYRSRMKQPEYSSFSTVSSLSILLLHWRKRRSHSWAISFWKKLPPCHSSHFFNSGDYWARVAWISPMVRFETDCPGSSHNPKNFLRRFFLTFKLHSLNLSGASLEAHCFFYCGFQISQPHFDIWISGESDFLASSGTSSTGFPWGWSENKCCDEAGLRYLQRHSEENGENYPKKC